MARFPGGIILAKKSLEASSMLSSTPFRPCVSLPRHAGANDGGEGDLTEPENVDELHREVGEEYQGKTFNYQNIVPYYFSPQRSLIKNFYPMNVQIISPS